MIQEVPKFSRSSYNRRKVIERDIGPLYVNKDGCWGFIKAHGALIVTEKLFQSRTFSVF